MKKFISILLTTAIFAVGVSGCSTAKNDISVKEEQENEDEKQISIVTTIFPEYDWVKEIAGDEMKNMDITMLLDNGVDLHSYQPTADDIAKISDCDLFIYVGGESDGWVDDALGEAVNKNMKVINLLDVLGESVKEEEVVDGMQAEKEESEEESEEEEPEYDEHVWLSLKNAKIFCNEIEKSLEEIDPDNAEKYESNLKNYRAELDKLDAEYENTVSISNKKTLVFGDRFPFRYLVDDYGLKYYAAFVGCSAETEASFETITFLAQKVDELGLKNVLTIEKSDQKIAKTIIENTKEKNQNILTMDSMQSTTSYDVANGENYIKAMEDNLKVLKEALK